MTERLYSDLAGWFHLLTAPEDYADEAAEIVGIELRAAGFEPHVEQLTPEIEPDWHAFVARRPPG